MKGNARWTENFTDRSTKLQNTLSTVSAIASSVVSESLHIIESGKLSISDAQLNSRGFVLHKSVDKLDLDELNAMFIKVGFPHRQKKKLEHSLKNTPSLVWVEERKSGFWFGESYHGACDGQPVGQGYDQYLSLCETPCFRVL